MQEPGQKLRRERERLRLTYRDVEQASQKIANYHGNYEYTVGLSRLADIENKGTVPTVYRIYSLCAIYRLQFALVLRWYGIDLEGLPIDASHSSLCETHPFDFQGSDRAVVELPLGLDSGLDFRKTSYLSRHFQRWGKLSVSLLNALDLRKNRYAFIGTDDWSMYPIISPGSFIQIDTSKHRILKDGWVNELDRPIYFLEARDGFKCGWCSHQNGFLFVQPHSTCPDPPKVYPFPGGAEIIGQVIAVAMRLDQAKRRHTRS